jgi:Mrp family chromosome partitioning ATPase
MNGPTFAPPAAPPKPAPTRPAARPGARPDPDAGTGLRALTYLRLHWLMILFCGTLIGAVGSYAAWELLASKFESYGLLQVSQVPPTLAQANSHNSGRTDFVTYVRTMSGLIKSEFVLNAALRDLKDLPTLKAQKDPLKYLSEEVTVGGPDGSEVIRVSMAAHNPADAKRVVDAVQKAFLTEVVQKEVAEKQSQLRRAEDAKQDMQKLLESISRRPDVAKAPMPGGVTPAKGEEGVPPGPFPPATPAGPVVQVGALELIAKLDPRVLISRFTALQSELDRLPLEIGATKSRMVELEKKIEALKTAPINALTLAAADADQQVHDQARKATAAKAAYDFAAGSGRPDAPGVVDLHNIWKGQEARLKEIRREKAAVIEWARREPEMKRHAVEWEGLKHQLARYEAQLATARDGFDRVHRHLSEIPDPTLRVTAEGRLERQEAFYDPSITNRMGLDSIYAELVKRHHLIKLDLVSPERVRLLQPASSPMQKDMKKQVLGTVAAGLFGYVLVALGVVAFETVSRRVSSLADLKSTGPAPVVGVIPGVPGDATGRDPARRAAANEAIDKLRAYVAQTWLSRGATCVTVTSPLGDEGKAFTAFGLASSLAQAGYKTLLVDFDLRDPSLHTYAGVPNQVGACEVLRAEADARAAVVSLPSGLAFLPAGKWSDEARKAAVGGRLEGLLAKLKEPYDCVILHGHALLTVAESVEVARRCEVVLVCARYRETKLPLLQKATDRVAAMEIPYSGVVYVGASESEALC